LKTYYIEIRPSFVFKSSLLVNIFYHKTYSVSTIADCDWSVLSSVGKSNRYLVTVKKKTTIFVRKEKSHI